VVAVGWAVAVLWGPAVFVAATVGWGAAVHPVGPLGALLSDLPPNVPGSAASPATKRLQTRQTATSPAPTAATIRAASGHLANPAPARCQTDRRAGGCVGCCGSGDGTGSIGPRLSLEVARSHNHILLAMTSQGGREEAPGDPSLDVLGLRCALDHWPRAAVQLPAAYASQRRSAIQVAGG
jgi:hypothetical protein